MGGKFCFFTDPAKLGAQAASEAFGPAPHVTGSPLERFQVTDCHQPKTGAVAKAYAVCVGQVCLQAVRDSTGAIESLNLILRPLVQPPFDFPYVEYFIYRGLRFDSLVTPSGKLDLSKEGTGATRNALIAYIREQVLEVPAQASQYPGAYLGLDREHDGSANGPGPWGNLQPIDHLFRYAGGAELPILEAGDLIGEFDGHFGFEVVVQNYGAQPRLLWTRVGNIMVDAPPLATATTLAAIHNSRLRHEEIGCFIDPCAFWGMFWSDGLSVPGSGMLMEKPLCDLLFDATAAIFANRGRAYLDIRNEIGLSYDFYGLHSDQIRIGPSKNTLVQTTYRSSNWPIHYIEPTPAKLYVRLRRTGSPAPLLYVGSDPASPFQDILDPGDPDWTKRIRFKLPHRSGRHPPRWIVAHHLRGETGTAAAVPATGAFDTSLLQFGPIGDRVIAAYRQLWPVLPGGSPGGGTTGYERQFVTDKVPRHDGAVKIDPTDPNRSLAYDRVGETSYIFQKGTAGNAGEDSVIIFQRRSAQRKRDKSGSWNEENKLKVTSSGGGVLFSSLTGELLSSPVWIALDSNITVPSLLELRADTPIKAELFDYTILLLSKNVFEQAIYEAAGSGAPPAPGEEHPVFLSLAPMASGLSQASTYTLGWEGWNGSAMTGDSSITQVYSADGILFASPDFDRGSLASGATPQPALTIEEKDGEQEGESHIIKDDIGNPAERMGALTAEFVDGLAAVDTSGPDPPAALSGLVEQYAPAIWDRAVELVKDPNLEEWADRILYYARLRMQAALKSHPLLLADPALAAQLADRLEAVSRNYPGLDFSNALSGDKCVIATGFDPFPSDFNIIRRKDPNPSGRLALHFAAYPNQAYTQLHSNGHLFAIRTCIFPNRYRDFDKEVVEKTVEAGLMGAIAAGKSVEFVCTISLDDNISSNWVKPQGNLSSLFCKIDGFAARCRGGVPDNLHQTSTLLKVSTLPLQTSQQLFYKTGLDTLDCSRYDHLLMKIRYDPGFSGYVNTSLVDFDLEPNDVFPKTLWAPTTDPFTLGLTSARAGSGGHYFSNESYYRTSNLIQSKYSTIRNGHIHVPALGAYPDNGLTTIVRASDLAMAVVALLDGMAGP